MGRSSPPRSVSAGVGIRPLVGGTPSAYALEVLNIVARIPKGKVLTYGDIAELVGRGSGRTVGAVMSRHGHEVAWHRVVLSNGHPNPAGPVEALRRLVADGTPLAKGAERVELEAARWSATGVA
jgi:methylated-DNA-protein-cysteine methyltransferase related protein